MHGLTRESKRSEFIGATHGDGSHQISHESHDGCSKSAFEVCEKSYFRIKLNGIQFLNIGLQRKNNHVTGEGHNKISDGSVHGY